MLLLLLLLLLLLSVGNTLIPETGLGIPPETEASHFDAVLGPFAEKYHMDIPTFIRQYNDGVVREPELDEYFLHDRAVRESGHDTTYRLEGCCAYICAVDLNCLLYRYEMDIAMTVRTEFQDSFPMADGSVHNSAHWLAQAEKRKQLVNQYCWNEQVGMFFDYNTHIQQQSPYESVTTFYALWSGLASVEQAERMVYVTGGRGVRWNP